MLATARVVPGRCRFLRDILVRHKTVDLTAQRRKRALVDAGFSHIRISHDARPIFQASNALSTAPGENTSESAYSKSAVV